jgi:hypothetical protein
MGVHIHITVAGSLLSPARSYARRQLRSGLASLRGAALTAHSSRTLSISHPGYRAESRSARKYSVQISLSQLLSYMVSAGAREVHQHTPLLFSRTISIFN